MLLEIKIKEIKYSMMKKLLKLLIEEEGTTAIEYGLIAALIAVAIVIALTSLNNEVLGLYGLFERLADAMR